MCHGRELWKGLAHPLNGEQFNTEEAGWCWGEVEREGKGEDCG